MKKNTIISILCSFVLVATMSFVPVYGTETVSDTNQTTEEKTTGVNDDQTEKVEQGAIDSTETPDQQAQESMEIKAAEAKGNQNDYNIVLVGGEMETIEVPTNITDVKSLNEKIVTIDYYSGDRYAYLYGHYRGTTQIVMTDEKGVETVISVTVNAPPLELSGTSFTIDGSYNDYFYWNYYSYFSHYDDETGDEVYEDGYYYEPRCWIIGNLEESTDAGVNDYSFSSGGDYISSYSGAIVKVVSSNTNVVQIVPESSHEGEVYNQWDEDYCGISIGGCFDLYPVGPGTATLTCTSEYGASATVKVTVTKRFITSYLNTKSTKPNLKYGTTVLNGSAPAGTVVTVKTGGKKYKATASSKGVYSIKKIAVLKVGTKIYYTFSYKGCTATATRSIVKPGTTVSLSTVYRKTKKVKVTLKNVRAGETFQLKIGKKKYKKAIKKTASKLTFTIKIKKKKTAGSKIKAVVINKYKQTMGSKSAKVYYASKIKKGMTKKQCRLVPGWEHPDETYVNGKYTTWWYDDDGDGYAIDSCLRFKRGKLIGWYY